MTNYAGQTFFWIHRKKFIIILNVEQSDVIRDGLQKRFYLAAEFLLTGLGGDGSPGQMSRWEAACSWAAAVAIGMESLGQVVWSSRCGKKEMGGEKNKLRFWEEERRGGMLTGSDREAWILLPHIKLEALLEYSAGDCCWKVGEYCHWCGGWVGEDELWGLVGLVSSPSSSSSMFY